MSERILKALMQLFAVIARPESNYQDRELVVKQFLLQQLNIDLVTDYLKIFHDYYLQYQKKRKKKLQKSISLSSVKVLKICSEINQELTLNQKVIVLLRLLEFIKDDVGEVTEQEEEFVYTVSDSFYIPEEEYIRLKAFVIYAFDKIPNSSKMCLLDGEKRLDHEKVRHVSVSGLDGQIRLYHVVTSNMYLMRYLNAKELYINGQPMHPDKVYVVNPGASIRNPKIRPIYYSDIVSIFNRDKETQKITFGVNDIEYRFKGGVIGINRMSFTEETGKLVGIMGASGAGKSTLLNVLNGNNAPTEGSVTINGIDIHKEKEKVEGLIGFVSQDDLLIEELTVFQNLYYNAKLCFGNYSKFQIVRATVNMLKSLGLYEIKDMKVGSPLNKKISGGQRKRLNISLELIREPSVLFLDEPTSGLSSRDSENIMDLLKELALKGKLIYVVIHQPSSDIFKMFDRLLILDTGGYLIYSGDPVDSVIYFKTRSHHANWNESECHVCGNVNPEQVFNIVEAKVLDEYGNLTSHRKRNPKDWKDNYHEYLVSDENTQQEIEAIDSKEIPEILFKIPSLFKQFKVFLIRDVLSKLSNTQYLVINFLEAPVIAFFLSYLIKYFNINAEITSGYVFSENDNLPVYIFMSVIVAIFIGLTVSAEEIIKDRLILKREEFLNLSWNSYLSSKVVILLVISAIQAFLFIIVGNLVLEIKAMYWQYWLVLFSAWTVSILFGLNISNSFKTAVTVYILIPFLVIPNIILSGIMVKFEKLNPQITSPGTIPFYGEIIPARWAYEALATYQYKDNKYEVLFYKFDKVASNATYKKDYWLTDLKNKVNNIDRYYDNPEKKNELLNSFILLRNEFGKENKIFKKKNFDGFIFKNLNQVTYENFDNSLKNKLKKHISKLRDYYVAVSKRADQEQDKLKREMQKTEEDKALFIELKRNHYNQSLSDFVRNKNVIDAIIEFENELYQKIDPIYQEPETNFVLAHFYSPYKKIFGLEISTYWMNLIVLWLLSLVLYITLYFSLFKRFLTFFEKLTEKLFKED